MDRPPRRTAQRQAPLHHGDDPHHPVRSLRCHLDGAVPGQADQRSHHRAARCRQRSAQGQPQAPRGSARGGRTGAAGARLQPDDRRSWNRSSRELDRRRRFTEAILESIPTGVISIGADGSIKRVNRALAKIFPADAARPRRPPGRPLLARGHRRNQVPDEARAAHRQRLAPDRAAHGNPQAAPRRHRFGPGREAHLRLRGACSKTPASCCARRRPPPGTRWRAAWRTKSRIRSRPSRSPPNASRASWTASTCRPPTAASCASAPPPSRKSVESVKTLVDEFSQFARFPAAQPVRCDLNEVVARRAGGLPGPPGWHRHPHQLCAAACRR